MRTITITDAQYEHVCEQFGAALRQARESIGFTQQEFANDIGRCPSCVANWEKGRCLPRARMLYHLAKWMGLSVDWLFGFSDEMHHRKHRARAAVGMRA